MSDVRVQILQVWWDDCDPETYRMQTKACSSRYRRGMLVFLRLGKLVVASMSLNAPFMFFFSDSARRFVIINEDTLSLSLSLRDILQ